MATALNIFLATTIVSLMSLIGVCFLSVREATLQHVSTLLVAFASGALLGGVFFHLLPEALVLAGERMFPLVALGIVVFFALEKFLAWRHCHAGKCDVHTFMYLNLLGDGLHNFLDGILIAGSFLVSVELGVITTVVVIFHEIPQELGDFGVLIYGGFSRTQALVCNLLSALAAVGGGMTAYCFSLYVSNLQAPLLALAAGGFLYVALVDLLPELHKQRQPAESLTQFVLLLLGMVVLWVVKFLTHGEPCAPTVANLWSNGTY
jgi:zinc and cadmium transporter